jgi:hypothetical protein
LGFLVGTRDPMGSDSVGGWTPERTATNPNRSGPSHALMV